MTLLTGVDIIHGDVKGENVLVFEAGKAESSTKGEFTQSFP